MLGVLRRLEAKRGRDWVIKHLTIFADDIHGGWKFTNEKEAGKAIGDIGVLLATLEEMKFRINYSKSAAMMAVAGNRSLIDVIYQLVTSLSKSTHVCNVVLHAAALEIFHKSQQSSTAVEAKLRDHLRRKPPKFRIGPHLTHRRDLEMTAASFFQDPSFPDQWVDGEDQDQSHLELIETMAPFMAGHSMGPMNMADGLHPLFQAPAPNRQGMMRNQYGQKRQRGSQGHVQQVRGPGSGLGPQGVSYPALLRMMAIQLQRQEEALRVLAQSTAMMFFMQAGPGSFLPNLLQLSQTWHQKQAAGQVDKPLRQHMSVAYWTELGNRVTKAQEQLGQELGQGLMAKKILTAEGAWAYMAWDQATKSLKPTTREPIKMADMLTLLKVIVEHLNMPGMITRFKAHKAQKALKAVNMKEAACVAPWQLDISLRHPQSSRLWESLVTLQGNGVLQLLNTQMRAATLRRSKLCDQIAQQVFKKNGGAFSGYLKHLPPVDSVMKAQFVCMQIGDRLRAEQPQWPEILDADFRLTLPHLVDDTGVPSADNVEWRAYQAMLFSSSGVYLCDDGRSAKLLNDDEATQVPQSWTCESDDTATAMTVPKVSSLEFVTLSVAEFLFLRLLLRRVRAACCMFCCARPFGPT
ncbi:unnamed protein product [Symbiodinium sp. CCMP2456]|nr:unnamed protein product [Symbiodinium sp. CCMP2456]